MARHRKKLLNHQLPQIARKNNDDDDDDDYDDKNTDNIYN